MVDTLTMYKGHFNQVLYLAGWYGLGPYFLSAFAKKVISVDYDPKAKSFGKRLFPNKIEFVTKNILEYTIYKEYECVILTSCEHLPSAVLSVLIAKIPKGTLVCFQSTDYDHPSHINTHKTVKDLVNEFPSYVDILYADSLQIHACNRHMVIAKI